MKRKVHLVFPFSRMHLAQELVRVYEPTGVILHPLNLKTEKPFPIKAPWIKQFIVDGGVPAGANIGLFLVDRFMRTEKISPNDYYAGTTDDDIYEDGVLEYISTLNDAIVVISMKRGQHIPEFPDAGCAYPTNTLIARPENMKVGHVGGEQIFFKGKIFKEIDYGCVNMCADGTLAEQIKDQYDIRYEKDLFVRFNYYEPGRWTVGEPIQIDLPDGQIKLDIGNGSKRDEDFVPVDVLGGKINPWELPLKDNSVSEIWSSNALNHVSMARVNQTLREWLRVLKPTGRAIIQVPNFDFIAKYWLTGADRSFAEQAVFGTQQRAGEFHRCAFTASLLKSDIEAAGFEVKRVEMRWVNNQEMLQAVCIKKSE